MKNKVLVHCDMGFSRSPSIALLFLIKHGLMQDETLEDFEAEFIKENRNYYETQF